MLICYVDESGDEQPLRSSTDPPVLVIAGLVVGVERSKALIWDFLQLKKRFVDQALGPEAKLSDVIRHEIKGSDLRSAFRAESRRGRRRTIGILDNVIKLLERRDVSLIGEVHIKADGGRKHGRWVYSNSVASLAEQFEVQLRAPTLAA